MNGRELLIGDELTVARASHDDARHAWIAVSQLPWPWQRASAPGSLLRYRPSRYRPRKPRSPAAATPPRTGRSPAATGRARAIRRWPTSRRRTSNRLGAAWVARLPGGVSSRATPVVDDGVLYLTGGANVFAVDGRTGETVWRWEAGSSPEGVARVPSWQGVGLGDGLVFVGLRSAEVAALRQETGELVWAAPGREHAAAGRRVGHHGPDARPRQGVRGNRQRRQRRAGTRGRPRRGDRRAAVDVLRRAAAGGVRARDVAAGHRSMAARRGRRLAGGRRRPRAGHGLLRHRQPGPDVRRRDPRRRQPVHGLRARPRHGDRRAALALPGGAARHLGRRHRHAAAALRDGDRRADAQGAGRDARRRASLPVRPGDRRADRPHRGTGRCRRTSTC